MAACARGSHPRSTCRPPCAQSPSSCCPMNHRTDRRRHAFFLCLTGCHGMAAPEARRYVDEHFDAIDAVVGGLPDMLPIRKEVRYPVLSDSEEDEREIEAAIAALDWRVKNPDKPLRP